MQSSTSCEVQFSTSSQPDKNFMRALAKCSRSHSVSWGLTDDYANKDQCCPVDPCDSGIDFLHIIYILLSYFWPKIVHYTIPALTKVTKSTYAAQ